MALRVIEHGDMRQPHVANTALWCALFACLALSLNWMTTWPWVVVSPGLSAVVLAILIWVQFVRPWWRRKTLLTPGTIRFIITSRNRRILPYASQDDREHFVNEMIVPSNSEIPIELTFTPSLHFSSTELIFGFIGENLEEKPHVENYFTPFIIRGTMREGSPENNDNHYVDHHQHYHIKATRSYSVGTDFAFGFIVKTHNPGIYDAQITFSGDEAEGNLTLKVRAENEPRAPMQCVMKGHKNCVITSIPVMLK